MYYIRVMKTLASRLTLARLEKGLTQGELAKKAGVSQSTIGNLEAGIRLSSRSIALIAAILDVNALWLETGKGSMAIHSATQYSKVIAVDEASTLHPDIQAVIRMMEGTDDRGRSRIKMAVEDALIEHSAIVAKMQHRSQNELSDEEYQLISKYRSSGKTGRLSIEVAVDQAKLSESVSQSKKTG